MGNTLHAQSPTHHCLTGSCLSSPYSKCVPQHLKAQISFSLTRCDVLTQSREVDVWLLPSPPHPIPMKIQRASDPAHPSQYLQLRSCPVFKLSHRVAPFQNQGRESFSSLYLTSKGASGEAVEIRDGVWSLAVITSLCLDFLCLYKDNNSTCLTMLLWGLH